MRGEDKASFKKIIARSGSHGGDGQKKGELNSFSAGETGYKTANNRGSRAGDTRNHRKALKKTDRESAFGAELTNFFGGLF